MAVGRRGARDRDTGVTATARRGVGGGFMLAALVVTLIVGVIVAIIVVGILLRVFDANAGNSIVKQVIDLGRTLVGPFKDVFRIRDPKAAVAVNWGMAAVVYLVVGSLIARVLRRLGVRSHPDRGV